MRVFGEQPGERGVGGFGYHVVAGGVAGTAFEAQIQQVADDFGVQGKQAGKAAGLCDNGGEFGLARADGLQCLIGAGGIAGD